MVIMITKHKHDHCNIMVMHHWFLHGTSLLMLLDW